MSSHAAWGTRPQAACDDIRRQNLVNIFLIFDFYSVKFRCGLKCRPPDLGMCLTHLLPCKLSREFEVIFAIVPKHVQHCRGVLQCKYLAYIDCVPKGKLYNENSHQNSREYIEASCPIAKYAVLKVLLLVKAAVVVKSGINTVRF